MFSSPSTPKTEGVGRRPIGIDRTRLLSAYHQTRKGNQWYFGMKAHVGVDSRTKLIHSVVATSACGPCVCSRAEPSLLIG